MEFPRIQGADVCGQIVAVGAKVAASCVGERVLIEPCLRVADGVEQTPFWYIGSECDGGFTQYTRVDTRHPYAINSDLTDIELASFPCSYSTAENMLTRANVKAGETVLVTDASGGVGSAAVQLARARGANVIAITSPAKMDTLIDLGAERILPRSVCIHHAPTAWNIPAVRCIIHKLNERSLSGHGYALPAKHSNGSNETRSECGTCITDNAPHGQTIQMRQL